MAAGGVGRQDLKQRRLFVEPFKAQKMRCESAWQVAKNTLTPTPGVAGCWQSKPRLGSSRMQERTSVHWPYVQTGPYELLGRQGG